MFNSLGFVCLAGQSFVSPLSGFSRVVSSSQQGCIAFRFIFYIKKTQINILELQVFPQGHFYGLRQTYKLRWLFSFVNAWSKITM